MTALRLSGFGVTVVPRVPFRIERVADSPETTLRVWSAERESTVDVDAIRRGEAPIDDALEVSEGDEGRGWRIETDVFSCSWPRGFALSSDPDELSTFLLVAANDAMLWISGPLAREKVLPIDQLADEDQTVRAVAETAAGDARLDLDYVLEGELWWQRRYVIAWDEGQALVLSAQSKASDEEWVRDAIDELETSIDRTRVLRPLLS